MRPLRDAVLERSRQGRRVLASRASPASGHRDAIYANEHEIAASYAKAYLKMGFEPLYFGVTTLEEVAPDVDWRFAPGPLNILSERIQSSYEYAFMLPS